MLVGKKKFDEKFKHVLGIIEYSQDRLEREKFAEDGSYKIVYLGDGITNFQLELTWLADRTEKYDLGDEEFHLAFEVDDYEGAFKKHTEMGCVVFVNDKMGIYFITDPDGYWIEILPPKK